MKIMFVIKSMAVAGGAERVLSTISSGLAARGHDVSVLTFDQPGELPFYPLSPAVRLCPTSSGDSRRPTTFLSLLGRAATLRSVIRTSKPDLAVGFLISSYAPLSLAAIGLAISIIASEHIVFDHYRTHRREKALLLGTARLIGAYTAVSERMKQTFPRLIRRKMHVCPNPVAIEHAKDADVEALRRNIILSVGRLDTQKDHATLISSFGSIAARFPEWSLHIFGDGPLKSSLQRQIEDLKLEDRVMLCGTTRDIGKVYRSARIFVLPSRYESLGLVTAEALAHGLPAIGFADCVGTNDLIESGVNGLLVDPDDRAGNLADALETLMKDDALRDRLGNAAPASVNGCSLDAVVGQWESLLQSSRIC